MLVAAAKSPAGPSTGIWSIDSPQAAADEKNSPPAPCMKLLGTVKRRVSQSKTARDGVCCGLDRGLENLRPNGKDLTFGLRIGCS